MIEQTLKQLGWPDKKITVYMTLLKIGPSPVRTIAAESGVNRGTAYDVLKALRDEGLVAYYQKKTRQYFTAEDPSKLLGSVSTQIQELEHAQELLKPVIAQMRTVYMRGGQKPVVLTYEGTEGVAHVLSDVLERSASSDKKYYAYSAENVRSHIYKAMPKFNKKRIDAGVSVRVIGFQKGGDVHGLDERKSIEKSGATVDTYVFIYDGRVAYVSQDVSGEPVGMIIDNAGVYSTEKNIFESLWENLSA